jgi:hypothetical protein
MPLTDRQIQIAQRVTKIKLELANAVLRDENPRLGGFKLSQGLYGPNVTEFLKKIADASIPQTALTGNAFDVVNELLLRGQKILHDLEHGNWPKPNRLEDFRKAIQAADRLTQKQP